MAREQASVSVRFEYLIGIRYLRARRRERFVSLIALISLVGVALGTFALTVVLSVMSGFQEDLRDRLLAFNPQITLEKTGASTGDYADLSRRIASDARCGGRRAVYRFAGDGGIDDGKRACRDMYPAGRCAE